MRKFVYVDTESTGLEADKDKLTEVAYAIENGPIKELYFGVHEVPDFIAELTKFYERGIDKKPLSKMMDFHNFREDTKDMTMVAANPAHDKAFLQKAGLFGFHYRMLDISSFGMACLRLNEMPGMKDLYEELTKRGYNISPPDHSAAGDVRSMREIHVALVQERDDT